MEEYAVIKDEPIEGEVISTDYVRGYNDAVEKACRYFKNVLMQRWGFKKDVATSEADLIKRIMTEE